MTLKRRLIVAAVLFTNAALAHALDVKPYSAEALAAAQKANLPVALHFHADWCPTCRAQDKVLQSLKTEPGLDLTVLRADYDTEKDLKRRLGVRAQSTLVVFKGQQEVARLLGDTSTDRIRGALKAAF
ncbi:MAG: thioredoxin family protein [Burkholderiales bacterium]|nr:thioredoxin family protein [Burkholderiales bacterium]